MKKFLFLLFFAPCFIVPAFGKIGAEKPNIIIVDEEPPSMTVTADGHAEATSVTIQLILADGSVYAEAQTQPGKPVSFTVPEGVQVRRVRATFYMLSDYIIQEEVNPD